MVVNIKIDRSAHRLIDFGIARVFQPSQKGTMIGTEGYSPPEQYRGEASPAGDIYALGATLHHLLTRRDPRAEPPFSFSERPVRQINPHVSPELEFCNRFVRVVQVGPAGGRQADRHPGLAPEIDGPQTPFGRAGVVVLRVRG
jgi:serine/threonine protein kinase